VSRRARALVLTAVAATQVGCFRCAGDGVDAGMGADAAPQCTDGETRCMGAALVATCVGEAWSLPEPCPANEVCADPPGSCAPSTCDPGTVYCSPQADAVLECDADGAGETVLEECAPPAVCFQEACVTVCAIAAMRGDVLGCEYYALDTNNAAHDDPLQYSVLVANPDSATPADVVVEARSAGGAWSDVASDTLAPGATRTFDLADRHAEGSAVAAALAYRLTSSMPVIAYQLNSDDVGGAAASSGATLLHATPSLGATYFAVSLPASIGSDALVDFGMETHSSGFAVVGVEDGTTVDVTASTDTTAGAGVPALAAGEPFAVTIDAGDVLQIEADVPGEDVTGTHVSADHPIAVFGYHECATLDPGSCDHVEEQLDPVERWPSTHVCVPTEDGGEVRLWRIVGSVDGTSLAFADDPTVTGLPDPGSTTLIDAGNHLDFAVDGPGSGGTGNLGDFRVDASSPIYVVQFTRDEPNMIATGFPWIVRIVFAVPPDFTDYLTAVHFIGGPAMLDGGSLGAWSDIDGYYEVSRTSLVAGMHELAGGGLQAPLGVYLSGRGASAGWGLVGGIGIIGLQCIGAYEC
jgi:hypothetical protein